LGCFHCRDLLRDGLLQGRIFFAATFLAAAFFVVGAAFFAAESRALAAFASGQRFLVAAMILFIPSSLIRRFALGTF
jgi:hypothetical protein